jgi:hypothetical protein
MARIGMNSSLALVSICVLQSFAGTFARCGFRLRVSRSRFRNVSTSLASDVRKQSLRQDGTGLVHSDIARGSGSVAMFDQQPRLAGPTFVGICPDKNPRSA